MDRKSGFEPSEFSRFFYGDWKIRMLKEVDDGGLPCALSERCSEEALKNSIGNIQHFVSVAVWSAGAEESAVISKRPGPLK